MRKHMYIYGLYGDFRGEHNCLRYIGLTWNCNDRAITHWQQKGVRNPQNSYRKNKWLRSLNQPPEMRVLLVTESRVAHRDGEVCFEGRFMETLIIDAAIEEFGRSQILNARYWRKIKK